MKGMESTNFLFGFYVEKNGEMNCWNARLIENRRLWVGK